MCINPHFLSESSPNGEFLLFPYPSPHSNRQIFPKQFSSWQDLQDISYKNIILRNYISYVGNLLKLNFSLKLTLKLINLKSNSFYYILRDFPMRSYLLLALTIISVFCLPVFTQEDIKKERVLVVLDNLAIRDTHSLFFQDLESNSISALFAYPSN